MTKINLNKYAMEQRIAGKLLREIGEEMGVGVERARQRVAWGFRHAEKYERDKNATTMGDLFMSARAMNTINTLSALDMTFDEFLENVSQQNLMDTPNAGKMCVKELVETLRNKNVSEEKISAWLNVKIKKVKKKPMARLWQRGPEEKFETCQQYVIGEGRAFMGKLCGEPLTSQQKKYCSIHRRGKK
jgi:post-segregation antitoxin (ccd killing protein)